MAVFQFISESGVVGMIIVLVGFLTLGLVVERAKALYFDLSIDAEGLSKKMMEYLIQGKPEEAVRFLSSYEQKPLARALRNILTKVDREDEAVYQAQDVALTENMPLYTRRLHYLSMYANVATLLGLLGTIHGLILSFAAVAAADPSQKQVLLANGISVSMYTTALGLAVAIPAMVAYSVLSSKQTVLSEQMQEKTQKLVEFITGTMTQTKDSYQGSAMETAVTPPPAPKVRSV